MAFPPCSITVICRFRPILLILRCAQGAQEILLKCRFGPSRSEVGHISQLSGPANFARLGIAVLVAVVQSMDSGARLQLPSPSWATDSRIVTLTVLLFRHLRNESHT